eukprot:GHVN01105085.1.p1 GENE.GHVN01105085.1~~GHVN01105085.1.p1  ORF type:complete len:696 (+),score=125.16 GHVN01105085.1:457-2544(+)
MKQERASMSPARVQSIVNLTAQLKNLRPQTPMPRNIDFMVTPEDFDEDGHHINTHVSLVNGVIVSWFSVESFGIAEGQVDLVVGINTSSLTMNESLWIEILCHALSLAPLNTQGASMNGVSEGAEIDLAQLFHLKRDGRGRNVKIDQGLSKLVFILKVPDRKVSDEITILSERFSLALASSLPTELAHPHSFITKTALLDAIDFIKTRMASYDHLLRMQPSSGVFTPQERLKKVNIHTRNTLSFFDSGSCMYRYYFGGGGTTIQLYDQLKAEIRDNWDQLHSDLTSLIRSTFTRENIGVDFYSHASIRRDVERDLRKLTHVFPLTERLHVICPTHSHDRQLCAQPSYFETQSEMSHRQSKPRQVSESDEQWWMSKTRENEIETPFSVKNWPPESYPSPTHIKREDQQGMTKAEKKVYLRELDRLRRDKSQITERMQRSQSFICRWAPECLGRLTSHLRQVPCEAGPLIIEAWSKGPIDKLNIITLSAKVFGVEEEDRYAHLTHLMASAAEGIIASMKQDDHFVLPVGPNSNGVISVYAHVTDSQGLEGFENAIKSRIDSAIKAAETDFKSWILGGITHVRTLDDQGEFKSNLNYLLSRQFEGLSQERNRLILKHLTAATPSDLRIVLQRIKYALFSDLTSPFVADPRMAEHLDYLNHPDQHHLTDTLRSAYSVQGSSTFLERVKEKWPCQYLKMT